MGYDLHITRAEHWSDNTGAEITAEEWLAVVHADPELRLAPEVGMGPYFVRWTGPSTLPDPWLDRFAGNVDTKNPDPALIGKMVRLAERLGARVQGDEGELYTDAKPSGDAPAAQVAARSTSWWRRLTGG